MQFVLIASRNEHFIRHEVLLQEFAFCRRLETVSLSGRDLLYERDIFSNKEN